METKLKVGQKQVIKVIGVSQTGKEKLLDSTSLNNVTSSSTSIFTVEKDDTQVTITGVSAGVGQLVIQLVNSINEVVTETLDVTVEDDAVVKNVIDSLKFEITDVKVEEEVEEKPEGELKVEEVGEVEKVEEPIEPEIITL